MSEKAKETPKKSGIFTQLKDSLKSKTKKQSKPEPISSETAGSNAAEPIFDDGSSPLGRGVIEVHPSHPLFLLREEWMSVNSPTYGDTLAAPAYTIVLEPAESNPAPMDDIEMESEKIRFITEMQSKTALWKKLTRPDEEGNYPDVNAFTTVHTSHHRMAAWVFVFPPYGAGEHLQREELDMLLEEHNICAGLDEETISRLLDPEDPIYFQPILIARGTPMIPGKDGYMEELFERHRDKTFAIDEHGNMDYKEQEYVQIVRSGDIICNIIAPTPGTAGIDVLGREIPPKDGVPAKIKQGQNTVLNYEKTQIMASTDGMIHYEDEKFHVKPTFYVDGDVDFHVGNIDFLGDVYVTGNIREDFTVRATGSITVKGLAEASVIEAEKDILISQGILGDDKGIVKAGGAVRAGYIENTVVYAKGIVEAGTIIGSAVYSDQEIKVTNGRGTVIGGKLVAANKIEANIIGCRAERLTTLIVGELPYIQLQKEETILSLESIKKEADEIERNLTYLTANEFETDPKKIQAAANFRLRRSVLNMKTSQLKRRLDELDQNIVDVARCRIRINRLYPITKITMGEHFCMMEKADSELDLHVMDGTIMMR